MAENNTPSLDGFDVFANMLTGGTPEEGGRTKDVNEPPLVDPEKIKADLSIKEEPIVETPPKEEGEVVEGEKEVVEEQLIPEKVEKEKTSSVEETTPDLGEFETDVTTLLNEKFSEELGWDIPEEEAPKTVKEFVDFMKEVVSEASAPAYANDEVAAYDEYVRNGGSLRDFYKSTMDGKVDIDALDLDNTFDQKQILKEYYGTQGYADDRINKMLTRYENAGVLEDEATDAKELLKDYNTKTQTKLLEDQKKSADLATEQQQNFVSSVEDSIKKLDNVRGVKISEKDRGDLTDYILKPDAQGITQYQRDYMSDIKNLLESAYFTKKGDALINKSKAQGNSDAVKNLHDKLKANKGDRSRQSGVQGSGKASSGLSVLGSMLQGNN